MDVAAPPETTKVVAAPRDKLVARDRTDRVALLVFTVDATVYSGTSLSRRPSALLSRNGSGAFGRFEVTSDVSAYTKTAVIQPGTTADLVSSFSSVAGERGTPDTWRAPSGYAVEFSTAEGDYDMVGNNTPVFSSGTRDPKFQHRILRRSAAPTTTCGTTTSDGTSGPCPRSRRTT